MLKWVGQRCQPSTSLRSCIIGCTTSPRRNRRKCMEETQAAMLNPSISFNFGVFNNFCWSSLNLCAPTNLWTFASAILDQHQQNYSAIEKQVFVVFHPPQPTKTLSKRKVGRVLPWTYWRFMILRVDLLGKWQPSKNGLETHPKHTSKFYRTEITELHLAAGSSVSLTCSILFACWLKKIYTYHAYY